MLNGYFKIYYIKDGIKSNSTIEHCKNIENKSNENLSKIKLKANDMKYWIKCMYYAEYSNIDNNTIEK